MADSYIESLLGERERVLMVTHQHLVVLLRSMAWEVLSLIALLVGITLVGLMVTAKAVYAYVLLILPLLGMIVEGIAWHKRAFIVTNRRVIQISGIFNKDVTDSSLEMVNDVKMDQSFLGRILNYGDIEILTASELGANIFKRIDEPIRFKTAMLNAKEEMAMEGNRLPRYRAEMDPRSIPDLIARLDQLRRQGAISEQEFQQKKVDLLRRLE